MVSAFQDETGADRALETLQGEGHANMSAIHAAAVICRDSANMLQIREVAAWSGARAAATGALIGGGIGLLFPPGVFVTGPLGATIGELGAHLSASGFPDARLKKIGQTLGPGTSAVIAIVSQGSIAELESQLTVQGARCVHESISEELVERLAHPQPTSAPVSPTSKTNADEGPIPPKGPAGGANLLDQED
jgi:uncharacterized membrane protein